ncbi:MAG: outer membrane beta-barrel protein [Nevskia sp.]|nr:outer membrane beta-barrel protein [Nevskia sp.]
MKKFLVYGAAAGAMAVCGMASAQLLLPPKGNLAIYGSYMKQTDDPLGLNPDGFGSGVQLGLNLTRHFFIDGSYQYDYLNEDNAPSGSLGLPPGGQASYGLKIGQGRAGGGLVFHVPLTPLDVFGKIDYTHLDYQYVHATVNGVPFGNSDRVNDDGQGYHVGVQARVPGLSVYGSVGYLNLSKSEGPEFNVGLELPVAPFTWGFVEYRYDNLHDNGYFVRDQLNDVRAGVRLAF